jgi:hypothetical protein
MTDYPCTLSVGEDQTNSIMVILEMMMTMMMIIIIISSTFYS